MQVVHIFTIVLLVFIFLIFIQPLLVLYFSWRKTNFSETYLSQSLPYSTDISGFAGLPDFKKGDQLIGQAAKSQETCENGYYVGLKEMTNVDCTRICNATSSTQFGYKYITGKNVVVDNQYLRQGGWCLPTSLVRCNLNISIAVKSLSRYECISKFPKLLGGQNGNDIIGCAPTYEFRDNLRKITYTNNVPSTIVIDDLDERLPDSDEYRYTCNTKQFATFERPELGNRFQLYYDSCGFFDKDGKMVNNKCQCSQEVPANVVKPLLKNQRTEMENICSTCTSGYEIIDERSPQYGSKYGVSIGVNCVDPERIEYYKTMYIEMNGVVPCGIKTLTHLRESPEAPKYGCQRALLNVTNSYTPEMLQRING
ncbi:per os infectivity factor 2 [Drosophila suzukii associated hytrosavirus 1]|nr:per os infectivity factor 2 [Drosophila suzukii associated hytrosavirus 1]